MKFNTITAILILAGLLFSINTLADDVSDVTKVVQQYGDLENDLAAQAKLMHPDRIYISGGIRQTDEAKNMAIQITGRKAGGVSQWRQNQFCHHDRRSRGVDSR